MKPWMMIVILTLSVALAACARQDHQRIGDLRVSVAWARETPPQAPVGGAYLTVQNTGATDDRLLAVESSAAERVELHEASDANGVARMRELAHGLVIPAGATVTLAPGGSHLMFIHPSPRWVAGGRVDATLVFEKAGRLPVSFDIRSLSGQPRADAHAHH
jgi:copper(I)-binding protein